MVETRHQVQNLLRTIEREAALTGPMTGRPAFSREVMQALARVRREEFVPAGSQGYAYANTPLPIGAGQTISQPFIVALMTDLLDPRPEDTILEIGTGSGYQAAVLAEIVRQVYSIEIISALAVRAGQTLQRLGYRNVELRTGDGRFGWPERAPFDGIIVTAAAVAIPPALPEQLKPGARLIVPVGRPHQSQELILVEKDLHGRCHSRSVLSVAFVPLTGGGRRPDDGTRGAAVV